MKKRQSGKSLTSRYLSCTLLVNLLVITGFGAIVCRAFHLQVIQYDSWVDKARQQAEKTLEVPAYRGSIYDRQGRLLSYSVPQKSLYAEGPLVEDPKKLAASLATIIEENPAVIERKLASGKRFVWIKRLLTDQQAVAVEMLGAKGLCLTDEYKRFYPYRQVAGQIVGFVGMDGVGLEGVEKSFDRVLRANRQAVEQLRDAGRKGIWMGGEAPPEPGESYGVRLTIDTFIQYVAEEELEKQIQKYHAAAGEVVVVDTSTSEVLAMAHWPFFDPNDPGKKNADSWRNRIVTDSFEPGSTFKVFLMAAALDQNVVKEKDRVFCENGKVTLARNVINDVHPYGWLTMQEVIQKSSNIGASKIALQLGNERYYKYLKLFGFGTETGVCLPGEVNGLLRHHKKWRPIDLATVGFGQGINVTPLQLTLGIACLANGGQIRQPLIARDLVDCKGQPVHQFGSKWERQVVHKKTADQLRVMMQLVTQAGGTGTASVPDGYTVAGKTGTAQVLDRVTKRYAAGKYTSVFTGFIPAENPRLAMSIVIHEPHGAIYGGVVAAPVFKTVAAKVLPYLGVPPDAPPALPAGVKMVNGAPKTGAAPAAHTAPPPKKETAKVGVVQNAGLGKEKKTTDKPPGATSAVSVKTVKKETHPQRNAVAPVGGKPLTKDAPRGKPPGTYALKTEGPGRTTGVD